MIEPQNMAFIPKDAIWYIADILEEIRVSGYKSSSLHINTILIRASSPEDAYKKANAIGKAITAPTRTFSIRQFDASFVDFAI
jgi:hypothetical protein